MFPRNLLFSPIYSALNPSDTDSHITISGNNLIATQSSGVTFSCCTRGISSRASGKWHVEFSRLAGSGAYPTGGFCTGAYSEAQDLGQAGSVMLNGAGNIFFNGIDSPTGTAPWSGTGGVMALEIDLDAQTFSAQVLGDGGGRKTVSYTGISAGAALFPAINLRVPGDSCSINLGQSAFQLPLTSGYFPWG